jgi:cyclohexa-1,5-dienecarbonyl-CoA hydratase
MTLTPLKSKLDRISLEFEPPVARIVLRHAPLNVIDVAMMEELAESLRQIEARDDVSTIILTGEGKAFSVGVDVAAHTPNNVEEMLVKFHAVIRALIVTRKVTVATVQGYCLGGGAELAMISDIVYTSASAQWGFPEIKLGCYPPVACTALATLVGQKRAAELILTGRTISGKEAAEIGLANRAVREGEMTEVVDETVSQLRGLSSAALGLAKKASYAWDSMHFDKGLARAERIYFDELRNTADADEGIRAFMEKREPKWTNK